MCVKRDGAVCGKPGENGLCYRHTMVLWKRKQAEARRARQQNDFRVYREVLRRYAHDNLDGDPANVYEFLTQAHAQDFISTRHLNQLFRVFIQELMRARNARPLGGVLEAFAMDNQNVHRKVVTDNTNDQTKKLLEVTVPSEQNTLAEVRTLFPKSRKLIADVEHWYGVTMCRKEADCLYKRTLDGLWALIKASPHREELSHRLAEEIAESLGQCCEGHLSRLCNVLVGFDEAFTTVVSKAEILQQKMADIAALGVTERTKKMRAKKVLRELEIPVAEHAAWLDAF